VELQPGLRSADSDSMLMCRACNTRFDADAHACPSCGRRAAEHAVEAGAATGATNPDMTPLPPASPMEMAEVDEKADEMDVDVEVGLELGEDTVVEERRADRKKRGLRARFGRQRDSGSPIMQLDARQVRTLVGEQPGLLEKGLGIYSDEDGKPVGVDFQTPVGEIDLLVRDRAGAYVVVMVPQPGEAGAIVPEILQRIGWVRKHLASSRTEVRGVVVLEQLPEDVAYAAVGVAGTVAFTSFSVALSFHDLEF
jgi:hypothetical protein